MGKRNKSIKNGIALNAIGTIKAFTGHPGCYGIVPDEEPYHMKFAPSNIPDNFKKEGLRVIFSGKIGKIPYLPGGCIRILGLPLELTSIEELKEEPALPQQL